MLTHTVSAGSEEMDRIPEGCCLKRLVQFQEYRGGARNVNVFTTHSWTHTEIVPIWGL